VSDDSSIHVTETLLLYMLVIGSVLDDISAASHKEVLTMPQGSSSCVVEMQAKLVRLPWKYLDGTHVSSVSWSKESSSDVTEMVPSKECVSIALPRSISMALMSFQRSRLMIVVQT